MQTELAVHSPAKAGAFAAGLRPDLARALAGDALIPQVGHGALVRAVAAPAVEHLVAAVIEDLAPARKREAHAAGTGRLGLFSRAHDQASLSSQGWGRPQRA